MDHKHCFEAVDRTFRDVMSSINPVAKDMVFGGKTVVLGGYFRQVLPVVEHGSSLETVQSSIVKSKLWHNCELLRLEKNMWLSYVGLTSQENEELGIFAQWLLDVGNGNVPCVRFSGHEEAVHIKVPHELLLPSKKDDLLNLFDEIYPHLEQNMESASYFRERAILTPTNAVVDDISQTLLDKIDSPAVELFRFDSICKTSTYYEKMVKAYPIDYLNNIELNGMPAHKLVLKVGTPVILLRNLNQQLGLCNGTRLIIKRIRERVLECEILTGDHSGEICFVPRITLSAVKKDKLPFVFKRRQYPVRVSFAMTINKSQGQTLKKVGIYLPQPVFSHGQLYVALSRVQSKSGLRLLIKDGDKEEKGYTKNIVYKEVFRYLENGN